MRKLREFRRVFGVKSRPMDSVIQFLTESSQVFGYNIHNWVLGVGAVAVLWGVVLVRDL